MSTEKIIIFDTTLRDGEQAPGATMNLEEKILIAKLLEQMGVDVIEAGFAISSKGDFQSIEEISKVIKNSTVCSLARAKKIDIEAAGQALEKAAHPRIHTFISTSKIHMEHQIKMNENEVLEATKSCVSLARNFCDDVEWSGMDASRSDKSFLFKAIETAISAGATTINIPDTVGYSLPEEFGNLISEIKNNVINIDKAVISVHCHNDLGLAVANSLAAVKAGARQIECTINGLGERAGNAALEEIVMAIATRSDIMPYQTSINTKLITRCSKLVSQVTGFLVQNNKAIVGSNAFAHESGIHQDGILKNRNTYEIMTPESVGLEKTNLVMGKHSGRHAFKLRLQELGYDIGHNRLEELFDAFKALADKKKHVTDNDIIALVDSDSAKNKNDIVKLSAVSVYSGNESKSYAKIKLTINETEKKIESYGDGPVDSIFKGIKELYNHGAELDLYDVHSITGETDAIGTATVRLKKEGKIYTGTGSDTDILVASALAYINAINKMALKDVTDHYGQ